MSLQSPKIKSAAKIMLPRGPQLQQTILDTLKTCSDLVGATLGPGGRSVIIEHQEINFPGIVTKDGVTVFRAMAFQDSVKHVIMEAARDCSIRTASEAGDGTTSATILAEAFVRYTQEYCAKNPHVSPQRVVQTLRNLFRDVMEPTIRNMAIRPSLADTEGRSALRAVANISANGDTELADAVMECYKIIGDEGNITITDQSGPSKYIVQKIDGYPISVGYEETGPFYNKFVNDVGAQRCVLERPTFVLHYGRITDFNALFPILGQIAASVDSETKGHKISHNVIVVATDFSENVTANMAAGFTQEGTLNVYPLKVPLFPVKTGNYDFLADLAALTGATIFDPLEKPLQNFTLDDLGIGPIAFEATRFRTNVIGRLSSDLVLARVDQIQKQLSEIASSELEKVLLRERLAKMTSGIARLIVQGSSHGENSERRDRVEDAIMAVRGAIKHGALPGGGVVLATLSAALATLGETAPNTDKGVAAIASQVAGRALLEPVKRLYANSGMTVEEGEAIIQRLSELETFDVYAYEWVDPIVSGILDSLPAVLEAVRNSISVAGLLGTSGGVIAFPRDYNLEVEESKSRAEFLRHSGINEADLRP
jgi:chaperonin GroEL